MNWHRSSIRCSPTSTSCRLPDGSAARLLYERTSVSDRAQEEGLYRRDLLYSAEYGTTRTGTAAEVVSVDVTATQDLPDATIQSFTLTTI